MKGLLILFFLLALIWKGSAEGLPHLPKNNKEKVQVILTDSYGRELKTSRSEKWLKKTYIEAVGVSKNEGREGGQAKNLIIT